MTGQVELSGQDPLLDPDLDCGRYWHSPPTVAFADQVRNDPATFPLLDLVDLEREQLTAAQAAAKQQRQHSAIALAFKGRGIGRVQKLAGLLPT